MQNSTFTSKSAFSHTTRRRALLLCFLTLHSSTRLDSSLLTHTTSLADWKASSQSTLNSLTTTKKKSSAREHPHAQCCFCRGSLLQKRTGSVGLTDLNHGESIKPPNPGCSRKALGSAQQVGGVCLSSLSVFGVLSDFEFGATQGSQAGMKLF